MNCNSMLIANIGFVIPNMDIMRPVSSLINIYNYMCKFPNKFNPIILSESNYFNNKYSDLYKIIKIEETFDFDSLNLKYIFFLIPYEFYYIFDFSFSNKKSQIKNVENKLQNLNIFDKISNKVKIMYVSYGYNTWGTINDIVFNHNFFRNVYMSFHESEHNKNDFITYAKQTKLEFFNEDNVFVSGCPKIIDDYYNCDDNCIINNKKYNIIYNTRWSNDDAYTVDIFLNTINILIKLHDNIKITYRPHPLTNNEILDKINKLECEKFVIERNNDNYEKMFMDYDIMISDASSFMTEFLSTGKPIIYTHKHNVFNTNSKIFEECYYKVTNEQELIHIMNELIINKNDFKHDDRIKIIDEYFKIYNPCKIISDILYDDYISSNFIN